MIFFMTGTSFNTEDKIKIEQDFPTFVSPGDVFIATITIHKKELDGWARLQQDLPIGFTAEVMDSHGAEFLVENNSVKFIWLKIPAEETFKITYRITTDKNITGKQFVNGVFMYIQDDKTERQALASVEISFEDPTTVMTKSPRVERKLICTNPIISEYRVELAFQPNGITDPAIFTDNLPPNFKAELIEGHGASFSFESNLVIFNWSKLPSDSAFTIAYQVSSGTTGPSPVIAGTLFYGEENSDAEQQLAQETTTSTSFPETHEVIPADQINNTQNAAPVDTKSTDTKNGVNDNQVSPVVSNGIIFKVQISATQKSTAKNNSWFESRYHLNADVEMTYHQGWKKYMIGNFQVYAEARAFRKKTQEKISDAFVVAYENGNRITVSEAMRNKSLNQ